MSIYSILLNNFIFFLFPKFLELFFTPKNADLMVKNSKMGLNHIVFGTPCSCVIPKLILSLVWALYNDSIRDISFRIED